MKQHLGSVGHGDGTFQTMRYLIGTGQWSWQLGTGDLNKDGNLDLAVSYYHSEYISVLLGNGDGSFQAKVDYVTGHRSRSVTAGDLNNDGFLDLIVGTDDDLVVSFIGNGDGTFRSSGEYPCGSKVESLVTDDFNGDGKTDVVTANSWSNNVSVLLGNGDGTFQVNIDYVLGVSPEFIITHDFNGDERLDLAIVSRGDTVSVLLNVYEAVPTLNDVISIITEMLSRGEITNAGVANALISTLENGQRNLETSPISAKNMIEATINKLEA